MWKDILFAFFVGGFVIALSVWISKHFSPTTAALFYSYPLVYVFTIAFMYKTPKHAETFAIEAIPAGVAIVLFLFMFPFIYHLLKQKGYEVLTSLFITTIFWIPLALSIFSLHWHL